MDTLVLELFTSLVKYHTAQEMYNFHITAKLSITSTNVLTDLHKIVHNF